MTTNDAQNTLLQIATEFINEGPGYAQQTVVLREAVARLQVGQDVKKQQLLLTVWHDLFREGKLSWGYNIDNPDAPFFHLAERGQFSS